jgi:hypothetical protein
VVTLFLKPGEANSLAAAFPQYRKEDGTNIPFTCLAFDAGAIEAAFWEKRVPGYAGGDLTAYIEWMAESATSGDVVWEISIAAVTPETDSAALTAKALATVQTVTDTHLGTNAKRPMKTAAITISNLDSLAAGDMLFVRVRRLATDGGDTMTGDAWLTCVTIEYPS